MLDSAEPLDIFSPRMDPFATPANARRRAMLALNCGVAGLAGEEDFADDFAVEDAPDQLPGTVQATNVKKAKRLKAAKAKKTPKFLQRRAATPGYAITEGGLVRQKGGVTARAHIEDKLFNRGERARRAVRDKSRELADRMRERKAALFDAEMKRQQALRAAEAKVSEAQTATLLAKREADLFKQEAEFARRVDPTEYEEEIIDAEAEEVEYVEEAEAEPDFDAEGDDEAYYDDEAYEGQAGFFDIFKRIAPAAASFIPGVGPIIGTALSAVTNGDKSKGAQIAANVDPNAKLVATQTGAPSFEVNLEKIGKVLLDSLGRVIAKKSGGAYQPLPEPKPIDVYAADKRNATGGAGGATLPLLLLGGGALLLFAMRRAR